MDAAHLVQAAFLSCLWCFSRIFIQRGNRNPHATQLSKPQKYQLIDGVRYVKELNRIVSAYLDLAENRAQRGIVTTMTEWVAFLNRFLEISDYPILADRGKVTALEAKLKAEAGIRGFPRAARQGIYFRFRPRNQTYPGQKEERKRAGSTVKSAGKTMSWDCAAPHSGLGFTPNSSLQHFPHAWQRTDTRHQPDSGPGSRVYPVLLGGGG